SAVLASVNPSEIILSKQDLGTLQNKMLLPEGVTFSSIPYIENMETPEAWPSVFEKTPLALRAALGALKYAEQSDKSFKEYFVPVYRKITSYMQLDASAVETLELVRSKSGNRKNTLWGLLDYTLTPMGARLLKEWLLHPLLDKEEILSRQNAISSLLGNEQALNGLALILREICDIQRIMTRVVNSSLTPREAAGLRKALFNLLAFENWFKKYPDLMPKFKQIFLGNLVKLKEISALLFTAINEAPPIKMSEGGIIRAGYNAELDKLRDLKQNSAAVLEKIAIREKEKTGIPSLKIGFNSLFGYYIEVTKSYLQKVPLTYTRKQTLTNAERFITEELKQLEGQILSAEEKSLRLESAIFDEIRKYLFANTALLKEVAASIAEIDCFYSLAIAAKNGNYICPKVVDSSESMIIEKGRHPLVEQVIPAGSFVPNNLFIGGDGPQIILITGPNMGGKSVYLKQTALIVLMAQMGSFVPAVEAQIPITDKILTRIGAQDALSRGDSTFMVEMREAANILASATPKTLVLLDEVGRGTSTFDGISIAWAITEYLHKSQGQGPKVLFATHYFELTELANKYAKIKNFHVRAEEFKTTDGEVKLNFLFEVKPGAADKSYGIHVAEIAGLPQSCILRARKILKDLGGRENFGIVEKEKNSTDLFSSPILEEIKMVRTDEITPLQALSLIENWKKRIDE
ncbi:MAG: DNA mismatch repair protein MutS, partial [Elusimicrobiaceae bacterium]|nr:DNA mismatch repair protein MutS [Elusimicrobiaceae bacterium]